MNSKIVNVIKKGELIFLMEKETKKSLLLITFGVVLFALLMHFSEVIKILQRGVSLTLPIMVGLILAFVLNVPMKMLRAAWVWNTKSCFRRRLTNLRACEYCKREWSACGERSACHP